MKKGFFVYAIWMLFLSAGISGKAFDGLEGVVILTPDEESPSSSDTKIEQEGLVLSINDYEIEKFDETHSSIVLHVSLMNWDTAEYELSDAIKAKLYYQESYAYVWRGV